MSLKVKLTTAIAALCMVICLLSVGVWAASSGVVKIDGSVSFVANDVNVTVYGEGAGELPEGATVTAFKLDRAEIATWTAETEDENMEKTWEPKVLFAHKSEIITLTITVVNNSLERGVALTFVPQLNGKAIPVNKAGDEKTIVEGNIVAYATADATVDKSESAEKLSEGTCTIVLSVDDADLTVEDLKLGGTLTIENQEKVVTP